MNDHERLRQSLHEIILRDAPGHDRGRIDAMADTLRDTVPVFYVSSRSLPEQCTAVRAAFGPLEKMEAPSWLPGNQGASFLRSMLVHELDSEQDGFTSVRTLTNHQIRQLRTVLTPEDCDAALRGDIAARCDCARAIRIREVDARESQTRQVEASLRALPEDNSHLQSYLTSRGVGAFASTPRFDGAWGLWKTREGHADQPLLLTRGAIDSASHLHRNLGVILHHAPGRDYTTLLRHAVDDWRAALKGHTSERTLTATQIQSVRLIDDEYREVADAALRGNVRLRHMCVDLMRGLEDERDKKRIAAGQRPVTATWSVWTSREHPRDEQLVITRQAIDALSIHQLHPHPRTRLVSFDGPETPTGNGLLNRAIARMPPGSTVVIATDRTPEGQALERRIQEARGQHPSHSFVLQLPERGRESWNDQLQTTRARQGPTGASKEAVTIPRLLQPRHDRGLDR